MDSIAPDVVLDAHLLGRDAPRRVALRRATTRWTVLVFEPAADAHRLADLAAVTANFRAEDAELLVVAPTPAHWAGADVPVVHDAGGRLRSAFGVDGRAGVVLAPDGTIWHAEASEAPERSALDFIADMRMGRHLWAAAAPVASGY